MAITYLELLEKLKQYDEFLLLDLLKITSEDIVKRWADEIEERFDELSEELGESEEETLFYSEDNEDVGGEQQQYWQEEEDNEDL